MRWNPLLFAMFALLVGGGGALALWVVEDTDQRSRCAAPLLTQDLLADTPAPKLAAPLPEHEVDRATQPLTHPEAKPPAPSAPETPKPAPRSPAELTREELNQQIESEAAQLNNRDLTEQDLLRLRELAAEMARRAQEEELAKYPFQFTATITGAVVDSNGSVVAGAQVLLATRVKFVEGNDKDSEKVRKSVSRGGTPSATTDAGGLFSIEFKQGFTREVESISFSASAQGTDRTLGDKVEFVLRSGESKSGLRLELPGTGLITGRVVTTSGVSVVGAQVMAQLDAPAGNKAAPGRLGGGAGQWVVTDAQGRFVIPALLDGYYVLQARSAGYTLQAGEYSAIVTSTRETELGKDLVLVPETALKITLTCAAYDPQGQSMVATFYDGQGNRISAISARVAPGGVTLFGKAPTQAVSFELSGGVYLKTNRIACSLVDGAHYDAGTLELTMREMPKRGNEYGDKAAPTSGETVKIKARD